MTGIEAALLAAGYGATAAAAIATAVNIAVALAVSAISMGLQALLAPKPDKGSISNRRQQLQTSSREPLKARELIVGRVRKGGSIVFLDSVNNESELILVIALAGHEVTAIDEIYFFDELAIDQAGVIQPKYKDLVEFEKFLGAADQAASPMLLENSAKWTADHRLRGIAYITLKLSFDRDIFNQIPNVSAIIRGTKVYDPRDDSIKYTPNPALIAAHYLNHPIYGLNAAYGTDIDNTRLSTSANECDEDVTIKAGKTLEFEGVDDVIDLGDVLNQTGAFSIEARVRPAVVNKPIMRVLDKDSSSAGFSLSVVDDKVQFVTQGLSNVTLETAPGHMIVDTWKHIAGVWNPATGAKTIYINGVAVASVSSVTGTMVDSSASLRIGNSGFADQAFQGRIQDVRLWSEARTATEVAAFYDKTLVGSEDNLAGYWKLDEKRGDRAEDATEIAHDGNITGAAWVDDVSILGTEKRYAANGVIFSDALPREIIEEMLTSMAGSCVFSGGLWLIRAGAYESPTVALNEDDARDAIKIQPKRSRRELFNAVRGTFVSPENEYQPADFPLISNNGFEGQDGGDRIVQDIELPFTTSPSMAQRIAWLHLLRNREQVSLLYRAKLSAVRLCAGNFVDLTNTRLGWSDKDFEVLNWQLVAIDDEEGNPALGVDLELRETNPIIYDFNPATDEVPLNPSPDTNLPSPFGNIALISDFVDRTGFEEISSPEQAGIWPGTIVGFVRNPLTGHLNAQDLIGADGNDFDVFDQYVQTPFRKASYESPEIDIEFVDIVRTFSEFAFVKGPGENGGVGIKRFYDSRIGIGGGFDPDAFDPDAFDTSSADSDYPGWKQIIKTVKAEGRYFKHKIEFDFHDGVGGYLASFTPVIEKMTLYQKDTGLIILPGGKTVEFPQRYHNVPSMSWASVGPGVHNLMFAEVTKTGFTAIGFDQNADDVGGTFNWQAAGV